LVHIRQVILGVRSDFPNNSSWRFVDANYEFPDLLGAINVAFPEAKDIHNLSVSEQAHFIGIKIGDVNGTASPNNLVGSQTRDYEGTLTFDLDDRKVSQGEIFTIDFKAKDFEMMGYQFGLSFEKMEFVDVTTELEDLSAENFGLARLDEGIILTSWNDAKNVRVEDGATLFSMTFQAKEDIQLSEVLNLSNQYLRAEAYQGTTLFDVNLNISGTTVNASAFTLYQNTPNPFTTTTTISFNLPEASKATMKIFDSAGRVLKMVAGDFAKGYNEINIDRAELEGAGVLYYQLDAKQNTAIKKMILID
ncbi:MAG: cohesin domain-containing protein, partial [Bacteroidota bacterium]